jgi:hypothetical protein
LKKKDCPLLSQAIVKQRTLINDNLWKQKIDVAFEEIYNISMLLPPEAAFISIHLKSLQRASQTHNQISTSSKVRNSSNSFTQHKMSSPSNILIIGGTRGIGLEFVRQTVSPP